MISNLRKELKREKKNFIDWIIIEVEPNYKVIWRSKDWSTFKLA